MLPSQRDPSRRGSPSSRIGEPALSLRRSLRTSARSQARQARTLAGRSSAWRPKIEGIRTPRDAEKGARECPQRRSASESEIEEGSSSLPRAQGEVSRLRSHYLGGTSSPLRAILRRSARPHRGFVREVRKISRPLSSCKPWSTRSAVSRILEQVQKP